MLNKLVTRLYFHEALSGLVNLPTSRESNMPGGFLSSVDAQNVNRTMDTTIGSSWTIKSSNTLSVTSTIEIYFTRFVSPPLAAQTINANTWNYSIAFYESNFGANFPRAFTGDIHNCVYLWRPGVGNIGFLINGLGNSDAVEPSSSSTYRSCFSSFDGASVVAQAGDVLCVEIIPSFTPSTASNILVRIAYDGTVSYTTDNQDTSGDIAAFLETPQDISFIDDSITMDVTDTIVLTNKFITKV